MPHTWYIGLLCSVVFAVCGCTANHPASSVGKSVPPTATSSFPTTRQQAFDRHVTYKRALYVAASANNDGDGSSDRPFDSIAAALKVAQSGTAIHVAAGTYPALGHIANLRADADTPIALIADGEVIIDAGGKETGMAFSAVQYLVLDGFTIQHTGIHGINIDDGGIFDSPNRHIVLRNMRFRNIGSGGNHDCLKLSGVTDFYIENSEFEGCNRGEAIDMVGCHNGIITGNYFHDMAGSAVQTKGGSSKILIHANRFENILQRTINAGGHTNNLYFRPRNAAYEAQDIRILSNLIIHSGDAAIVFAGCNRCIAANNTIIEPRNYIGRIAEENLTKAPGRDGAFINNIIVFNDAQLNPDSAFYSNGRSLIHTFTIDANLWFALDNPAFSRIPNGHGLPMGSRSIIQANPRLDRQFRPHHDSPARGAGLDVPGGLLTDFAGKAYTSPPDLGALSGQ